MKRIMRTWTYREHLGDLPEVTVIASTRNAADRKARKLGVRFDRCERCYDRRWRLVDDRDETEDCDAA